MTPSIDHCSTFGIASVGVDRNASGGKTWARRVVLPAERYPAPDARSV